MTEPLESLSPLGRPEVIDMLGGRLEAIVRMGEAEGDTALFRTSMAPGKLIPLHSHADPECFYVLSGTIELFLADRDPRWARLAAGDSLLVADGGRHAVRNASDRVADLVVLTNNRLARFFREAGRPVDRDSPAAPPSREDVERVARATRAFGYWMASPAESAALTG